MWDHHPNIQMKYATYSKCCAFERHKQTEKLYSSRWTLFARVKAEHDASVYTIKHVHNNIMFLKFFKNHHTCMTYTNLLCLHAHSSHHAAHACIQK